MTSFVGTSSLTLLILGTRGHHQNLPLVTTTNMIAAAGCYLLLLAACPPDFASLIPQPTSSTQVSLKLTQGLLECFHIPAEAPTHTYQACSVSLAFGTAVRAVTCSWDCR